ncbi:MAG: hypothetical protein WD066_13150 [Planctomycetaceae bacterium]
MPDCTIIGGGFDGLVRTDLVSLAGGIGLLALCMAMRPARAVVAETSLVAPWRWLIVGVGVVSVAFVGQASGLIPERWAGRCDYLAAVALLAPPIAVLGARRPGAGVWGWFVVLPMVCVLGLPAVTGGWWRGGEVAPLRLEWPPLIGFALVLVMGVGNYVGTRFTLPALLYGAAVALHAAPASEFVAVDRPAASMLASGSLVGLGVAAWLAVRAARQAPAARHPLDSLWLDFRDLFGIVWAKRALERVNHSARAQRWPVRLHLDGFAPVEGDAPASIDPETSERIETLLRWLLKRFVEPDWIDRRLNRA